MKFLIYIQDFNALSICIRLFLATLLGGLVGLERGTHGQPAGARTFALVCLGSSLVMITDEYLVLHYGTGDPARLAAQVISGIGFLGVGTIIVTGKSYVKGLTTAAGLWTTACLGIAIGSGYIFGAIIAFVLVIFVMTILTFLSHHVEENSRGILLYMEVDKECGVQAIYRFVQDNNFHISTIEKQKRQALQGKDAVISAKLDLHKRQSHKKIINQLYQIDAIHYIEQIK